MILSNNKQLILTQGCIDTSIQEATVLAEKVKNRPSNTLFIHHAQKWSHFCSKHNRCSTNMILIDVSRYKIDISTLTYLLTYLDVHIRVKYC